jgi:hypothetical protein
MVQSGNKDTKESRTADKQHTKEWGTNMRWEAFHSLMQIYRNSNRCRRRGEG